MSDEQITEYLRSRGEADPPMDLVASVMDAVDDAPQRRSWFASLLVPAFAAVGAAAILLAAVLLGQGGPPTGSQPSSMPSADASPTVTSSPSPSVEPSVTPDTLPSPSPSPSESFSSVFEDPDRCEDDSVGYRFEFPDAWWWNQPFDSEVGPHAQCRYLAPEFFEAGTVSADQRIPEGVAISVSLLGPDAQIGFLGEVTLDEPLEVAGHPATRYEEVSLSDRHTYSYVIELEEGRTLAFRAIDTVGDYDENRQVLDGMMQTLELFEPDEICGPEGDRFVCGEVVIGLADGTEDTIEDVLERNAGDPVTDSVAEHMEEIDAYVVAVPAGTEGDRISRYLLDDAVEYAELNGAAGEVAD